jgi:hypothetical protein
MSGKPFQLWGTWYSAAVVNSWTTGYRHPPEPSLETNRGGQL